MSCWIDSFDTFCAESIIFGRSSEEIVAFRVSVEPLVNRNGAVFV